MRDPPKAVGADGKLRSDWIAKSILIGNNKIYPKCASKKVSEMEISWISWKHIFNKLPLIQMRIDLVKIVMFAYINSIQTYEAYLTIFWVHSRSF